MKLIPKKVIDDHALAINGLSAAARAEFEAFWASLDKTDHVALKEACNAYVPLLIKKYGKYAQMVGKEFYMNCRSYEVEDDGYKPVTADIPPVEEQINWCCQYLFRSRDG